MEAQSELSENMELRLHNMSILFRLRGQDLLVE